MQNFEKIKSNRDFRRLYSRGKSYVTPFFVLYTAKGRKGKLRFGITVGKKIGGAVQRNRAKRIITAAFRSLAPNVTKGYDVVAVARTRVLETKSTAVAELMKKQFKEVGLWNYEKTD